jgi:hypothetical protein
MVTVAAEVVTVVEALVAKPVTSEVVFTVNSC